MDVLDSSEMSPTNRKVNTQSTVKMLSKDEIVDFKLFLNLFYKIPLR